MADNERYLINLMAGCNLDNDSARDRSSGANSLCLDGCDDFSDMTLGGDDRESMASDATARATTEFPSTNQYVPSEITLENENNTLEALQNTTMETKHTIIEDLPIPKGRSVAHHYFIDNQAVLCSFDIETGGEFCGIIQISAEIFRANDISGANPTIRKACIFNEYVKPHDGALWDPNSTRIHGLSETSPQIQAANKIHTVWNNFCKFINDNVTPTEACILVAYNGETCDLRWIWQLVQNPHSDLSMPDRIKFFLDPLKVIRHYKLSKLHPSKSKLESLRLESIYYFITGTELQGAHNSKNDVKAQTTIISSELFLPFIDHAASVSHVKDMFSKSERAAMMKKMEPTRPVYPPWKEQTPEQNITWTPHPDDTYHEKYGFVRRRQHQLCYRYSTMVDKKC